MFGLAGLKLYGAIGGAVILALFLTWTWRIDHLRAAHLKEAQAAELKLTISNTSLKECNGHIADNNKRINEANARLERARQQAAADIARADARWEATGRYRSLLEASARDNSQPACKVSQRAAQALEGL